MPFGFAGAFLDVPMRNAQLPPHRETTNPSPSL